MSKLEPRVTTELPGPKGKKIIELDKKYASPSYIKEYPLVVERGEGVWVLDVDGNCYLDMMAGIATCSTGHAHPKVVAAIKEAAEKFLHICPTDFYYDSFAKLLEKVCNYMPKMGPKKGFLTNSGTEAVEAAIKLARYHTKRSTIVAFKGAFHGRTMGAISLNSSKNTQKAFFGPLMPSVLHIPYPNPYRCPQKCDTQSCQTNCSCIDMLSKDWFVSHVDPKEVAAIFIEPILGEGGYVLPPKKFLQDLRKLCDDHGILLVFDEVQSGAGRTGYMYAAEYFDVYPDIFCTAKGLGSGMPIGAMVAKESVMTWPRGSHGSTYAGNPVCCASALATLEIVEGLLPQVKSTGEVLMRGLRDLQKTHPVLADIRGVGLMVGAEFVDPTTKEAAAAYVGELEQLAFRKGMLLLSCGKSTIRFAPPLIITPAEIATALKILDQCMTELDKKYGYT